VVVVPPVIKSRKLEDGDGPLLLLLLLLLLILLLLSPPNEGNPEKFVDVLLVEEEVLEALLELNVGILISDAPPNIKGVEDDVVVVVVVVDVFVVVE